MPCRGAALAGEGLSLHAALLLGQLVHNGNHDTVNQEAAGCLLENRNFEICKERNFDTRKGSVADNLTERGDQNQCHKEADAHAKPVERRIKNVVFVGAGRVINIWSEELWSEREASRDLESIRNLLLQYGL